MVTLYRAAGCGCIVMYRKPSLGFLKFWGSMLRLDYISCALTVVSTLLVGKKLWQGWIVAGANSAIICLIGIRTAQFGFVPANLFCIALYSYNLRTWRK